VVTALAVWRRIIKSLKASIAQKVGKANRNRYLAGSLLRRDLRSEGLRHDFPGPDDKRVNGEFMIVTCSF
jgi:hypothetical protein